MLDSLMRVRGWPLAAVLLTANVACSGCGSESTEERCLSVNPGQECKSGKDLHEDDFSLDGASTIKEVGSPRRAVMKEFWCSYSVTFRGDANSSAGGSGGSHEVIAVSSGVKPLQTSTLNLPVNEGDACPAQDAAAPLLQAQSNTLEIVSVNAAGVPSMSTKERCCYILTVSTF
jgi:hypothetical protein